MYLLYADVLAAQAVHAGAMLHCNCQTTGKVSPMGLYYQMPTMDTMQKLTLSETTGGRYRQLWQRAPQRPHYGLQLPLFS